MADATSAELVRRVLEKLHKVQGGDVVAAEENALVLAVIASVNEKLRDTGVAYWSDTAFPQAIKEDLALYVACHCAFDFMPSTDAAAFVGMHEMRSLANLKRLTAARERVDVPTRAEYF